MANEELRLKKGMHGRRDPIMGALREQSTHYEAATRITVYERLGLNKPGFWVDNTKRKQAEQESEEIYEPPKWKPPMLDYESQFPDYKGEEAKPRRKITPAKFGEAPAAQAGHKIVGPDIAANLRNQSKQWYANNNNWKQGGRTMGVMDVAGAVKARQMSEIADMLQGKGQQLLSHEGLKSVSQYYAMQATKAAEARARIPFGQGLPNSFQKMQEALAKNKPIVKGNTGGVSALTSAKTSAKNGISMGTPKMIKAPGRPQLNVHANGYASNYPYSNFS
jgi:hypothetical protein